MYIYTHYKYMKLMYVECARERVFVFSCDLIVIILLTIMGEIEFALPARSTLGDF